MGERDPAGAAEERALVEALRCGDERAFLAVVEQHHAAMVRVARLFVGRETAEDVVQDSWLAVLQGIGAFEGRSSLRSWLLTIVANRAKSRFGRDLRTVPFSSLGSEAEEDDPAVEPGRFLPASDPQWPFHWASAPAAWPEAQVARREALECVGAAIARLPPAQRAVITLRDVEGWEAAEVCASLGVSEANQRVLLHRARSKVRLALEGHFAGDGDGP